MSRPTLPSPTNIIVVGAVVFIVVIGAVFYFSYRFARNTSTETNQQLASASREQTDDYLQVRRIKLTDKDTGESMEIFMDGTVKYYDKSGKNIKNGRRGFAETQNLFKRYEWLLNNKQNFDGGNYYLEIETQTGTTTYNPGEIGSGDDLIDDTVDFIDQTVNPTPTPVPTRNPSPTPTPHLFPSPTPSPTPLPDKPDYLNAPPFDCQDYYQSGGKPLKISDTYCGIE